MMRKLLSLCVGVAAALLTAGCGGAAGSVVPSAGAAAGSAGQAAGLVSTINTVVSGLQQLADNSIQSGDEVLANRLADGAARLRALLPQLEEVGRGATTNANAVVDNAAHEFVGILGDVRLDVGALGRYATTNVNSWLAEISKITDIFVNVPPTLFAVSPSVLTTDNAPARIRLSGYLPGEPNRDIKVTVGGKAVEVTRGAAHSLTVPLSAALIKAGTEVEVKIRAKESLGLFGLLWKNHHFTEYVRISATDCFTCLVRKLRENPSFRSEISSSVPFTIEATTQGSNHRPDVTRTILVADLFRATMGAAASEYDANTAEVLNLGSRFESFGECGGRGPSTSKPEFEGPGDGGATTVRVSVHAPQLSDRVVRIGTTWPGIPRYRHCRAGGTKGVLTWRPVFKVARKDAQATVEMARDTLRFGPSGSSLIHDVGDARDWAYHVTCRYKDGQEQWATPTAAVSQTNLSTHVSGLRVHVANDRLLIEPTQRLQFE